MEFLIGLLVDFLVKFLIELFKQLFSMKGAVTVETVAAFRGEFVTKVGRRFWFGPNRVQLAERAYGLVLQNLQTGSPIRTAIEQVGHEAFAIKADLAVSGVKARLLGK